MERHFDDELKELQERLSHMGGLVERMVKAALKGLEERDAHALAPVFEMEREINHLHIEVDDRTLRLLALRQPIAVDLRLITSAMKMNNDLERMGDQAVNVAENTQRFLDHPVVAVKQDLGQMGEAVLEMMRGSLKAFVDRDVELALSVIERDAVVDAAKGKIIDRLVKQMKVKSAHIQSLLELILISRNLERIADHATNIAEDVVFLVSARDIRHHSEARPPA